MYTIDFTKPVHIHFIGIGGISMSGLAEILLKEGFTVSGSDSKESALTDHLTANGAQIFYGQRASNIIDGIDLVVYTAAIHPDNPEYACAKEKNIPMMTRADLLGQIMKNYQIPIAVSGTHGKTTTTSMASHILLEGGFLLYLLVFFLILKKIFPFSPFPSIINVVTKCLLYPTGACGSPAESSFRNFSDPGKPAS